MAVAGQSGFGGAVAGLDAVCERLEAAELARSAGYAQQLTDALLLDRLLGRAGLGVSAGVDLALRLRCSEWRADRLLEQARVLSGLPDGLGVLAQGLLTVEQVGVFVTETARLDGGPLLGVWEQLVDRLRAGLGSGEVLPPGRLATVLRRWVLAAAPVEAVQRRERAQADGRVQVRRREDGLVDLFALGITAPNAHSCLSRIQAGSAPVGPDDPRSADKRRLDALVDLLAGRIEVPLPGLDLNPGGRCPAAGSGCGCPAGTPVPCGADTQVLVPIGAALGTTGELAELVGAGPLDPDLLRRLLLAAPRLRAVWVDQAGMPLATGSRTQQPARNDPADLRLQLLALAAQTPPPPEPRCPNDHPTDDHPTNDQPTDDHPAGDHPVGDHPVGDHPGTERPALKRPAEERPAGDRPAGEREAIDRDAVDRDASDRNAIDRDAVDRDAVDRDAGDVPAADLLAPPLSAAADGSPDTPGPGADPPGPAPPPPGGGWAAELADAVGRSGRHPAGSAGQYRVPDRLRRLLTVRRPLCEWPGCGMPARRCDMEHDLAWPAGPTCGCNLGPCCRRHHRVKQTGWTKTRTACGVSWTGPTGRSWSSPSPHQPPARPLRPLPDLPVPDPLAQLNRLEWEQELWHHDPTSPRFDGAADSGHCHDTEPADLDMTRHRLAWTDTTWSLDLHDTDAWQDLPHPADR